MMPDKDKARELAKDGYPGAIFNPVSFAKDFTTLLTSKKMVSKFLRCGLVNEKLLVNNVVIAINVWGPRVTSRIFRLLCNDAQFSVFKAILIFLKCYDPRSDESGVAPHRIMSDILADMKTRYNIGT